MHQKHQNFWKEPQKSFYYRGMMKHLYAKEHFCKTSISTKSDIFERMHYLNYQALPVCSPGGGFLRVNSGLSNLSSVSMMSASVSWVVLAPVTGSMSVRSSPENSANFWIRVCGWVFSSEQYTTYQNFVTHKRLITMNIIW